MEYCTQQDIEARTGYGATDFKQAGVTMSADQWATLCSDLINEATTAINRFCRRSSFEEKEYTEFHDGRGCTGELKEYREADRIYLLREQPVSGVTSVRVDRSDPGTPPLWVDLEPRGDEVAGDYSILKRGPVSYLRFMTVPRQGHNNVEITYTAGYPAGSGELDDVRGICLDVIAQHLGKKKKTQEAIAARTASTHDAAEMTPPAEPHLTLTTDVKRRLAAYRRGPRIGGGWR